MFEKEREICRSAIEKWGPQAQTVMVFEEMSELQKELCKSLRGENRKKEIAEEIADVMIVLGHMMVLYDCEEEVDKIKIQKMERLVSRISEKSSCNYEKHKNICNELTEQYKRKNRDYGDSFHRCFEEEGMATIRVRLSDKINRFKILTKKGGQLVEDESIRDTLMDLANYAIMTVMEMEWNDGKHHESV